MEENKKQVPESVWAPGVPQNIKAEDVITLDNLTLMAINYLMTNVIIPHGFKIEPGFPRKEIPQIGVKKDGVTYGIIVIPSIFPKYVTLQDEFRIKLVEMCEKAEIVPLFAPVGYKSIDEERAKASLTLKGDVFMTTFQGFIKLTKDEKQGYALTMENFYNFGE